MSVAGGRWAGLRKLVLGSKSWSRKELLQTLDVPFTVAVAGIDESAIRSSNPRELVLKLGHAKANALLVSGCLDEHARQGDAERAGKALLITGDSVVVHKDQILEKPESKQQAREFLNSYGTAPATTVSSIIVVDVDSGRRWDGVAEAEVYFHPMPPEVIEELIDSGGSMESAGGLRIEHPAVERYTHFIIGEKSAVMGFSVSLVEELLARALKP
jgi:septum formation protein